MERNPLNTPFFSIIIPVYNRESRLPKALDSLAAQTFKNFETIVVDDCSTDNSFEVATKHPLDNKKVIRNERNQERCITRNNGITIAKGTYICFLDSDDHHLPEHLQELYTFIQKKDCPEAFFFSNAYNEFEDGSREERYCPELEQYNPYAYFLRYTVNPQRWAVHRNVISKHLFDPNINICEDMDVSLRIVKSGTPIFQLNKRTTCYVAASDSFTHGDARKWERELDALRKIFRRRELKGELPIKERWRLLSMCHFHLASKSFVEQNGPTPFWKHALLSLLLYPKGYNGKTTWPLFVMMVYELPFVGNWIRNIRSKKG